MHIYGDVNNINILEVSLSCGRHDREWRSLPEAGRPTNCTVLFQTAE